MPRLAHQRGQHQPATLSTLPEVADRLAEDIRVLEGIAQKREAAQRENEQWSRDITYEAQIGLVFKDTLHISPSGVEWKGRVFPLQSITRIGWGATRTSVNAIPTGTNYSIFFADGQGESRVQTNKEQIYSEFVERLWKAVGVRLLTEMLQELRQGNGYEFGDAVLDDHGLELVRHRLFRANERLYARWPQLHVWSAQGSFYVGLQDDKNVYVALPYQAANNAHVLEAAIRAKFKNTDDRLSSILEGS